MKNIIFISLLLPFLASCQTSGDKSVYHYVSTKLPKGSIVQLNEPLKVRQRTSRTYIQNGVRLDFSSVNIFSPWCQFRLYEPQKAMENERTIQPGRFTVVSATQGEALVQTDTKVLIASNSLFLVLNDDYPASKSYATTYSLSSQAQPQVFEFQCSNYSMRYRDRYLTIDAMKKTLGNVVTIHSS